MSETTAARPASGAVATPTLWHRVATARWGTTAALGLIVAVALWLRWQSLDYVEFSADQAWVINRAYEWIVGGSFPSHGIHASVGSSQGPVEIWLLGLPMLVSPDVRVATAFVGLLQTLAIVATYFMGARYFGRTVGLAAAALFAVNPWALQYARKLWTPNMMPLFSVLLFWSLFAAVQDRKRYFFSLACLLQTVLFLIHPAGIVFAPVMLVVQIVFWGRLGLKPLLLGVVLSLLLAAPFLLWEATRNFASFQVYLGVGTSGGTTALSDGPRIDLEALKYVLAMGTAKFFPTMMGYAFRHEWFLPEVWRQNEISTWLIYAGLALCVLQIGWWLLRRRRAGEQWEKYFLLLLWFVLPIVASLRHSVEFFSHYFVGIYPLQFLLIGLALASPLRLMAILPASWRRLPTQIAGVAVLASLFWLAGSNAYYFQAYIGHVVNNGPLGPYGVPLLYSERGVNTTRALSQRFAGERIYVLAYLQQAALNYLGRPDLELRHIDPPSNLVIPRDGGAGALFVLASDDSAIAQRSFELLADEGHTVQRLRALGFEELPDEAVLAHDGHPYYRYFHLPPGRSAEIAAQFTPTQQPAYLANGLRLRGYRFTTAAKPGEKVELAALWEQPDAPANHSWAEYNLFAHLTDGKGRELASQDKEVFQYKGWRSDDLMISYHELEVPANAGPGLVWFDLGAYMRFDRASVPWQDAQGRPLGGAVKIGPAKVTTSAPAAGASQAADYVFGEDLRLTGYDLRPARAQPGGPVEIDLHWQAAAKPREDWVISVQIVDSSGRLVAQHDAPPLDGAYPTSYWDAGERVVDRHLLTLAKDAPSGSYQLLVIAYRATDQQRLSVKGGSTNGDNAPLGWLRVGEPGG
ncbi:MAG: glycosyltransferase family 39 protein [Chloroflexota bacterium]